MIDAFWPHCNGARRPHDWSVMMTMMTKMMTMMVTMMTFMMSRMTRSKSYFENDLLLSISGCIAINALMNR